MASEELMARFCEVTGLMDIGEKIIPEFFAENEETKIAIPQIYNYINTNVNVGGGGDDANININVDDAKRNRKKRLLMMEQEKDREFELYPIQSLKDLSRNLPTNEVSPDPFINENIQFTIEDLCPLYHEALSQEISSLAKYFKSLDAREHDDFEFIKDLEFDFEKSMYLEELLIVNKVNKVLDQDIPTNVSDIISLVNREGLEVDLKLQSDQLVPEETGVKAPLKILNEWGIDDIKFDAEETSSSGSKEFDGSTAFQKSLCLEPALIPVKCDPLEPDRRKRLSDSLIETLNTVVSIPQKLDEEITLQEDLGTILKTENPTENWRSIIIHQPMDEIGGMKFKDNIIPTCIADILSNSNSVNSEFKILTSISGLKVLELDLHWNPIPIKKIKFVEFKMLIDIEFAYQEREFEDLCCCGKGGDDTLEILDAQFIINTLESPLRSRKEKRKFDYQLKKMELKDNISHHNSHHSYSCNEKDVAGESADIRDLLQTDMMSQKSGITRIAGDTTRWKRNNGMSSSKLVTDNIPVLSIKDKISEWLVNDCNYDFTIKKNISGSNNLERSIEIIDLTSEPSDEISGYNNCASQSRNIFSDGFNKKIENLSSPKNLDETSTDQNDKNNVFSNSTVEHASEFFRNPSTCNDEASTVENFFKVPQNYKDQTTFCHDQNLKIQNNSFKNFLQNVKSNEFSIESSQISVDDTDETQYDFVGLNNSTDFTELNTSKSIDDFLILRGKMEPNKRRNIDSNRNDEASTNNNALSLILSENMTQNDRHSWSLVHSLGDVSMAKAIIDSLSMPINTHKYIISARMLVNRGFLIALKGDDCKVELIERDFEFMRPFLLDSESETFNVECDLIIDENTGIIYYPLNLISQEHSVHDVAQTLVRLHQKYSSIFLIFENYTWNRRRVTSNDILPYAYTMPVLKALAELQVILKYMSCDTHIMFSPCEEISARLARMVGDICATNCEDDSIENKGWKDKQHPLINPFTAQIILTATTLSQYFEMSHEERYALVGRWIDDAKLRQFDDIIHHELLNNPNNDTENLFSNDGIPLISLDEEDQGANGYTESEWDTYNY
ncbi:12014_t:CDS:10 [Diversispora eburnea]|uniref:12014_t:CDS:1 n=1 Tax=Diversispora eburnea TaxID=1213867 RepID=A0A9N8V9T1_9GLOM|nr:12014_t:CDS:10 [Diversispora eburnea]